MNLEPAIATAVASAAGALLLQAGRYRRVTRPGDETYRFHPILAYLSLVTAAGCFWMAWALLPDGGRGYEQIAWLRFMPFTAGLGFVMMAAYQRAFRIRVDAVRLDYGAWSLRYVGLDELIGAEVVDGSLPVLLLYLQDGRRLRLPGLIGDAEHLAASLTSRVRARLGPGAGDSAAKTRDRTRRGRRAQIRRWAIGVTVVAIIVAGVASAWLS